jgi:hypothetical protein
MSLDLFPDLPTKRSRDLDAEFEQVWRALPRRKIDPKMEARQAFYAHFKAGTLPPLEVILLAAKRYSAHQRKEKTADKFLPHTRKIIRNSFWVDWNGDEALSARSAPVADWADGHPKWSAFKQWYVGIHGLDEWRKMFWGSKLEGDYTVVVPSSRDAQLIDIKCGRHLPKFFDREIRIQY